MDIATIIISAIGGIFIWNIFFSKGKNGSVCEAAIKTNEKPYTNIAPFDPHEVALRLREQLGTTDLQAMFEYFASKKKIHHPEETLQR